MHYAHISAFIYRLLIKLAVYWQTPYTTSTSSTANALVHFPNACARLLYFKTHSGYGSRSTWMWNDRENTKKAAPATGGRTIIYVK